MNIQNIIDTYDNMFGSHTIEEVETYLMQQIQAAMEEGDDGALITLLNELVGLMRDTFQKEKAIAYCGELKKLIVSMGLEGTEAEATSYQNIANAYRAFGKYEESLTYFQKVEACYGLLLKPGDYRLASLYNNWGLLYQEMKDYGNAVIVLKKSLSIIDTMEQYVEARATTRVNLANSILQLCVGREQTEDTVSEISDTFHKSTISANAEDSSALLQQAKMYTKEALALFEADGGRDFHYSAALAAMGDICAMEQDDILAADYFQRSLLDMEKHLGKNENYLRVFEKYQKLCLKRTDIKWKNNLQRSEKFYQTHGRKMLQERFPQYMDRIAVGLVGEGSDCFGYDDYISADHDYAPGFVIWLTDSDYALFGESLQEAYEELLKAHAIDLCKGSFLSGRRGVKTINGFYEDILGVKADFENNEVFSLEHIPEYKLAQAVNGKVFEDRAGIFSRVRSRLWSYYSRPLWLKKLAKELHDFSGYGQSNYPRAMARKDYVTAMLDVSKALESTMNLIYLLNKTYAPYDKWKMKGLEKLPILKVAGELLKEAAVIPCQSKAWEGVIFQPGVVNTKDDYVVLFEKLAALILEELKKQQLADGDSVFLESYVSHLMQKGMKEELVEQIVALEWQQFDKVKNEGGRASCQDDYPTFSIMRKSQYLTWNEELLQSYLTDLRDAEAVGWNLIMEKYARMMESTAKDRYEKLKDELPIRSRERLAIQEEIIRIQVEWMEDFAGQYPHMAGNARSIHTSDDNEYNTSYETYLRGELGTYSEATIALYGRMIVSLVQGGRNLAYETMTNTAQLYGYASVEDAEARMQGE